MLQMLENVENVQNCNNNYLTSTIFCCSNTAKIENIKMCIFMLYVVYFMSCVCSGWEVGLPAFIASSAGLQTNKRFVSLLDLLVFWVNV